MVLPADGRSITRAAVDLTEPFDWAAVDLTGTFDWAAVVCGLLLLLFLLLAAEGLAEERSSNEVDESKANDVG